MAQENEIWLRFSHEKLCAELFECLELLIMRVNLMMTEFNNKKVAYVLEQRIENIKLLIFVWHRSRYASDPNVGNVSYIHYAQAYVSVFVLLHYFYHLKKEKIASCTSSLRKRVPTWHNNLSWMISRRLLSRRYEKVDWYGLNRDEGGHRGSTHKKTCSCRDTCLPVIYTGIPKGMQSDDVRRHTLVRSISMSTSLLSFFNWKSNRVVITTTHYDKFFI